MKKKKLNLDLEIRSLSKIYGGDLKSDAIRDDSDSTLVPERDIPVIDVMCPIGRRGCTACKRVHSPPF